MRMRRISRAGLALAVLLAAPVALGQTAPQEAVGLSSGTLNSGLGFGARAMGMAGAFTAIADDASAASWNPAGLGQLIRPEVTIVGGYNAAKVETTGEASTFYNTTTGNPRLYLNARDRTADAKSYGIDFASFVQPFRLGKQLFTTQLSYARNLRPMNATESQRIDFTDAHGNDLAPDLYDTKVASFGGYDSYGIGFATGFDEKLYIGFTLNWYTGETSTSTDTRFQSYVYDSAGNQTPFADYRTQLFADQRYSGLAANVGILVKPSAQWSIGIVYRGGWAGSNVYQTQFNQAGHYTFNVTYPDGHTESQFLPFRADGIFTSNGTMTWPATLGGGVAYRPAEALTISFDASQTQWSRSSVSRIPVPRTSNCTIVSGTVVCPVSFSEKGVYFPSQTAVEQNNQTAYRLGVEYVLRPGSLVLPIRAGAYRIKTISPLYGVGDTDPETNFNGFTFGLGLAFPVGEGSLLFDMAGVFDKASTGKDLSVYDENGDLTNTQVGSRTVKNQRYIGSLIYRF